MLGLIGCVVMRPHHDNIEEELSALDLEDDTEAQCPYSVGTRVLLRRPDRAQKRQPPYECAWEALAIIAPSTVKVGTAGGRTKKVNNDLLKKCPGIVEQPEPFKRQPPTGHEQEWDMAEVIMPEDEEVNPVGDDVEEEEDGAGRYALRNRATLRLPDRYC